MIKPTTENIASLHDEVLRLSRLVNDLQEITLAESGNLALHHKKVNFTDLVKKVVNNFYGAAAAKEIRIDITALIVREAGWMGPPYWAWPLPRALLKPTEGQ